MIQRQEDVDGLEAGDGCLDAAGHNAISIRVRRG